MRIRIKDRRARKDLEVTPREFTGRLLRETCTIRCLPKDRSGRAIEASVEVSWQVVDGAGSRTRHFVEITIPRSTSYEVVAAC